MTGQLLGSGFGCGVQGAGLWFTDWVTDAGPRRAGETFLYESNHLSPSGQSDG